MSASHWEPPKQLGNQVECRFNMDIPIPVYLVALAIGDIAYKEIGPRSRVWTEPCLLVRHGDLVVVLVAKCLH